VERIMPFYKIFNTKNILRCTDKDVNDNWLEFLDFRNIEEYKNDVEAGNISETCLEINA